MPRKKTSKCQAKSRVRDRGARVIERMDGEGAASERMDGEGAPSERMDGEGAASESWRFDDDVSVEELERRIRVLDDEMREKKDEEQRLKIELDLMTKINKGNMRELRKAKNNLKKKVEKQLPHLVENVEEGEFEEEITARPDESRALSSESILAWKPELYLNHQDKLCQQYLAFYGAGSDAI